MLLETAVLLTWRRHSILYAPTEDESPYEETSVTFFNPHGLVSSLGSIGFETLSVDFLLGKRITSTKGFSPRHVALAFEVAVQKIWPQLVHAILGRLAIDRMVVICKPSTANKKHLEQYGNAGSRRDE
jgi:hypothetical protein